MKTQPNSKAHNDLEHLAEQGYKAFPDSDKDVQELKLKIKTKYGSTAENSLFIILSLALFIGITVFFTIYNSPTIFPSRTERLKQQTDLFATKLVQMDTVVLLAKKTFSKPPRLEKFIEPIELDTSLNYGQAENLIAVAEINSLTDSSASSEPSLKYAPNAPYIYLYDLKIANYNTYYFKSAQSITIHGNLNPDRANKNEPSLRTDESYQQYYLHEIIKDAMKQFKKQNFSQCLNNLNLITEHNKNDINALFYSGMCYYYLNDYSKAYKFLKMAQINTCNVFNEETNYYLAVCALKINKQPEAQQLLTDIVISKGFYTQKAKDLLAK